MLNYAIELFIWMTIATVLGMLIGWFSWGKKLNLILFKYSNLYNQSMLEKKQNIEKVSRLFEELESSQQKLLAFSEEKYSDVENLYINQLEKELDEEKQKTSQFKDEVDELKSQKNL